MAPSSELSLPLPPVEKCVTSIIQLAHNIEEYPVKEQVDLFQDAVAFLCHLKKDVRSIPYCQDVKDLRVLCSIVENKNLLHALMFMLACQLPNTDAVKGKDPSLVKSIAHSMAPQTKVKGKTIHNNESPNEMDTRKRSLSISSNEDDGPVNKRITASQTWRLSESSNNNGPIGSFPTTSKQSRAVITFNKPVFAAIVLYTSFRYVDQWPPIFLEAYSSDSFGSRMWVDDPRCANFVENLRIALDVSSPRKLESESMKNVSGRLATLYGRGCSELYFISHLQSSEVVDFCGELSSPFEGKSSLKLDQESESSGSGDEEIVEEVSSSLSLQKAPPMLVNCPKHDSITQISEQPIHIQSSKESKKSKTSNNSINSDSSDSDSEEILVEEVGFTSLAPSSLKQKNKDKSTSPGIDDNPWILAARSELPYILLNSDKVRCRFFGVSSFASINLVEQSLRSRLESRIKHSNTSLISCLPEFIPASPGIRLLVSTFLEKWLQSPALADLSRSLFTKVVESLTICKPPLEEDLHAISMILAMKVKANQFTMLINRVVGVARRLPFESISSHMFLRIFQQELQDRLDQPLLSKGHLSDKLRMFAAIYKAFPSNVAASGFASAILQLMKSYQRRVVIELLLNLVASLGQLYDGVEFVKYLITLSKNEELYERTEIVKYMDDIAHMLFESVVLIPETRNSQKNLDGTKYDICLTSNKKLFLSQVRKLVLEWCVTTFADSLFEEIENEENVSKFSERKKFRETQEQMNVEVHILGAGPRDFSSAFDGGTIENKRDGKGSKAQEALSIMECLLLLTDDIEKLKMFLGEEIIDKKKYTRITECVSSHTAFDDGMLRLILDSANAPKKGLTPSFALLLIETIIMRMKSYYEESGLNINDTEAVWDIYKLTNIPQNDNYSRVLAYPGHWWRATFILLILCGSSGKIGEEMWRSNPTLKSLITMVTTGRYCFPTIDCNDHQRLIMKRDETRCRDEESQIAVEIFLPKSHASDKQNLTKATSNKVVEKRGVRLSTRQRAKRERLTVIRQEEESAKAQAEQERIKRLLGAAETTIMIADPLCPARKPPREAVKLLAIVVRIFQLADSFRKSTSPDFLLMAVGDSSRKSIERSYEWILPIISSYSNIIARLPSSASCFLLLKAYEIDLGGSEKSLALSELGTPLLQHVRQCLGGNLGEADAIQAAELLLKDLYSKHTEQRQCTRCVLEKAFGNDHQFNDNQGWLIKLLKSKYAPSLVPYVVNSVSMALTYERGRVLCSYILALYEYSDFIKLNNIDHTFDFTTTLCDIISRRPKVVSAAIDRYEELRNLTLGVIKNEYESKFSSDPNSHVPSDDDILFQSSESDQKAIISMSLLRAGITLISFWNEPTNDSIACPKPTNEAIQTFTSWLIGSCPRFEHDQDRGIAGACFVKTDKKAITVDNWVMLTKARSNYIGRLAASCAPLHLLPRLCLCCGLSRPSFEMIMDRLNRVARISGEESLSLKDILSCFSFGSQKGDCGMFMKKLIGRIKAYLRIFKLKLNDTRFLDWLQDESMTISIDRSKKAKRKKIAKQKVTGVTKNDIDRMLQVSTLCSFESNALDGTGDITEVVTDEDIFCSSGDLPPSLTQPLNEISKLLLSAIDIGDISQVNSIMESLRPYCNEAYLSVNQYGKLGMDEHCRLSTAMVLLECMIAASEKLDILLPLSDAMMILSRSKGNPNLWQAIFSLARNKSMKINEEILISRCCLLWSREHTLSCQEWLLANWNATSNELSPVSCVSFLLKAGVFNESQILPKASRLSCTFGENNERISVVISMILALLKVSSEIENFSRIYPVPQWFYLLSTIAENRQDSCGQVFRLFMEGSDTDEILWPLLRLYASFPFNVPLNIARVRNLLLRLASKYSAEWKNWPCPLDETIKALIKHLTKSGVQALSDLCRQQPLIVIRHLNDMVKELDSDAIAVSSGGLGEKRGRIHAISQNSASYLVNDINMKVRIRHWGYSFTESVWIAILEVMQSIPKEVLFRSSGIKMGSLALFEMYLKLFTIQALLSEENNVVRMKSQAKTLLEQFKQLGDTQWKVWLQSRIYGIESCGTVETILQQSGFIFE